MRYSETQRKKGNTNLNAYVNTNTKANKTRIKKKNKVWTIKEKSHNGKENSCSGDEEEKKDKRGSSGVVDEKQTYSE